MTLADRLKTFLTCIFFYKNHGKNRISETGNRISETGNRISETGNRIKIGYQKPGIGKKSREREREEEKKLTNEKTKAGHQ